MFAIILNVDLVGGGKPLKQKLSESTMRLCFFICVITGCLIGGSGTILDIVLNKGVNLAGVGVVIVAFLTPAFGGKYLQKTVESPKVSPPSADK
jgi:NAD/NADP transhydrogenase beta subunit